jgi:RHS repeat-associated protein
LIDSFDYAINRHYDPQQGRFTQVDPIGMGSVSLTSPQTLNLYAYCINDPINYLDPSGLGFISFLKKLFNRVVNALIHAAITAAFTFIFSGGNLGAALAAGVGDFLKELGFPTNGFGVKIGGTPQWNPNAVAILSGGPSSLRRYIIYNLTTRQTLINPNCITNSVAGGILGATRNLIAALSFVGGQAVSNGVAAHDGIHVYAPAGAAALVTALPAMKGKILHQGRQAKDKGSADYKLGLVDIQLNTPINGQTYVMTLKDLNYASMQKTGAVRLGAAIGYVTGSGDLVGESGLHVTLMPKSVYDQYIGKAPSGPARETVPFGSLMDAARNTASPFRCP